MISSEILLPDKDSPTITEKQEWKHAVVKHYNRYMRCAWVDVDQGDLVSINWKTIYAAGLQQLYKDQNVQICYHKGTVLEAHALRVIN